MYQQNKEKKKGIEKYSNQLGLETSQIRLQTLIYTSKKPNESDQDRHKEIRIQHIYIVVNVASQEKFL